MKGVPQWLVLRPILLSIYLNDIFSFLACNICNFADNTTAYVCDKNLDFVLARLEKQSSIALKWFENSYMKINSG